jgi:hypothetical protein
VSACLSRHKAQGSNSSTAKKKKAFYILSLKYFIKSISRARCQWLTPVIPATQEAEIRITVQGQPRQIVHERSYLGKTLYKK